MSGRNATQMMRIGDDTFTKRTIIQARDEGPRLMVFYAPDLQEGEAAGFAHAHTVVIPHGISVNKLVGGQWRPICPRLLATDPKPDTKTEATP